ncbi:acetylgalactosaminyl-O-glycosyl-glycoprotein beta-1,3-N-acetylglucosaminyltransferase, partial [Daubentonia madagascariensis]
GFSLPQVPKPQDSGLPSGGHELLGTAAVVPPSAEVPAAGGEAGRPHRCARRHGAARGAQPGTPVRGQHLGERHGRLPAAARADPRLPALPPLPPLPAALGRAGQVRGRPRRLPAPGREVIARALRAARAHPAHVGAGVQLRGRPVRRLFLLGTAAPEDARAERLAALVGLEAREHGDVLQWAFADTFLNLTLKHVLLLDWLAARCPHARFLLSGDDDVFVHTANVLRFLQAQPPGRHLFTGQLMHGSVPIRDSWSKYFVPPQLFPGRVYPVYCSGGGFLLSSPTARALRAAAQHTPLFPIDDAYMGMCLEHAGLAPSGHEGIRPFGVQLPGAQQPSFDPCMYRDLLLVHRFAPYEMLLMWKALHDPALICGQRHRVSL